MGPDGFLDDDVGYGGGHVDTGHQRQRAGAVVHGGRYVVTLGHLGKPPRLADAAHPGGIHHEVVGGAAFQHVPVVLPADVHFADGQGHARLVAEVPERVHVVQPQDVLEPHQVQVPHGFGDAQGGGKLEEAVTVEQDLDPVAYPFAHVLQRLDALADRGHGQIARAVGPVRPVEGPELHPRVAFRHQFLRQVARGVVAAQLSSRGPGLPMSPWPGQPCSAGAPGGRRP